MTKELIVDNFAGGGGTSTGIALATGRPVDVAINHDPDAIAMHRANHPHTAHYCESVWDVDPVQATGGAVKKVQWLDAKCPRCGDAMNSWDVRCSKALGYKTFQVCEKCLCKEYDVTVEEFRGLLEGHFGMRPCAGI